MFGYELIVIGLERGGDVSSLNVKPLQLLQSFPMMILSQSMTGRVIGMLCGGVSWEAVALITTVSLAGALSKHALPERQSHCVRSWQ